MFWNTATSSNWSPGIYQLVCKGNSDTAATSPVSPIGNDGPGPGGPGTLFVKDSLSTFGTLTLDNNNYAWGSHREAIVTGDELKFDEVRLVRNSAVSISPTRQSVVDIDIARLTGDGTGLVHIAADQKWSIDSALVHSKTPTSFELDTDGQVTLPPTFEVLGSSATSFTWDGIVDSVDRFYVARGKTS